MSANPGALLADTLAEAWALDISTDEVVHQVYVVPYRAAGDQAWMRHFACRDGILIEVTQTSRPLQVWQIGEYIRGSVPRWPDATFRRWPHGGCSHDPFADARSSSRYWYFGEGAH